MPWYSVLLMYILQGLAWESCHCSHEDGAPSGGRGYNFRQEDFQNKGGRETNEMK